MSQQLNPEVKIAIKYILSVSMLLGACFIFFKDFFPAIFFLISAIVFFPPTEKLLFGLLPFLAKFQWRILIYLISLFIGLGIWIF